MSRDIFVYWSPEIRPSVQGVGQMLREYLLGGAREVSLDRVRRWNARLEGCGHAGGERWIEVYCGDDHIDVVTRSADSFTNAVAVGFAELCCQKWKGRIER